ncbi:MAG: secondary thiamine-phosphate synthase enzyme YjbQ [Planctomycetota bacterium]|jgi:secondary thiamine-phosphate synthase enzyme
MTKINMMVPEGESFYTHMEGNSDSHLKASMIGFSESIIVEGGSLQLGTWQGIYFCEFDGARSRKVWVKFS